MAEASDTKENPKSSECEDVFGGPVFEPRLYIQRYFYVQQQLAKFDVKHVVDFGSAECKISRFLVRIPTLEKLALVDLDQGLLEWHKYAIKPLACDFLERRDLPLQVQVYCGSVTELDRHVTGYDGVSMVEIIEHLQPDVLCAAVKMVFGGLQPNVVVITTPNADFNQLFPNFSGFRHWDHKFEWNRQEFQNWCAQVCKNHPYTVEYGGIGDPPPGSEHLGHCSQSAVFVRNPDTLREDLSDLLTNNYKLIAESFYPYKEKKMSEEETILDEINYQLRQNSRSMATMTGSCEMCELNRSTCMTKNETSARNQEEFSASTEYTRLNSDSESDGNQSLLTSNDQLGDKNLNPESDDSGNQYRDLNQNSDSSGIQTRNFNQECVNSGIKSTEPVVGIGPECPNCGNSYRTLNVNECYVPVSYLMSRKIKTLLQLDQLRKFLQSHGYRLSADCSHVITTVEENHSDFSDDDNIDTNQSGSELDQTACSELPSNSNFSLTEALQCESWD